MNTWMNNPQYLAQIGHTLAGALLVLVAGVFGASTGVLVMLAIGVSAAAVKEFWYDLKFELPKQTIGDSAMDFGFYMLGAVLGVIVYLLAHATHRIA